MRASEVGGRGGGCARSIAGGWWALIAGFTQPFAFTGETPLATGLLQAADFSARRTATVAATVAATANATATVNATVNATVTVTAAATVAANANANVTVAATATANANATVAVAVGTRCPGRSARSAGITAIAAAPSRLRVLVAFRV